MSLPLKWYYCWYHDCERQHEQLATQITKWQRGSQGTILHVVDVIAFRPWQEQHLLFYDTNTKALALCLFISLIVFPVMAVHITGLLDISIRSPSHHSEVTLYLSLSSFFLGFVSQSMLPHTSLKKRLIMVKCVPECLTFPLHNSLPVTFLTVLPEMFLLITAPSHRIALP